MARNAMTPRNIAVVLEYDGTEFRGFQVQSSGRTVQREVEAALERILGSAIRIAGAGRTDTGVHAIGQVATFTTESDLTVSRLQDALNGVLPRDIVVRRAVDVPAGFHARFSAVSRGYRYWIWNDRAPSAMWRRCSHHVRVDLDVDAMQSATTSVVGVQDFAAFAGSSRGRADSVSDGNARDVSTVRDVYSANWSRRGRLVVFQIAASGFLPHMVRNLVGTLLLVGEGRLSPGSISDILATRDRRVAGPTAPARGLCLTNVEYLPSAFSIQPATREASAEGRVTWVSLLNDESGVTADDD